MKRILLMIVATMFVAAGANALSISVDSDKQTYAVGEDIVLTATATFVGRASGPVREKFLALTGIGLEIEWDDTIASVKNAGTAGTFGAGYQNISAGPVTGQPAVTISFYPYTGNNPILGAPSPAYCSSNGYSCQFLTQTHTQLAPGYTYSGYADAQTLTATLILTADAAGSVGLAEFVYNDNLSGPKGAGPAVRTYGSNFLNAVVVPEPGTLLLVCAGLGGLVYLGRRHS
jgi:hypothetical protein